MRNLPIQSECCGCGACSQICPVNAITLNPNNKGFLVPAINENKCINCGNCERVCPVLHPDTPNNHFSYKILNAKNPDIRNGGSSGGVFRLLAEYVLSSKGIVIGAAFDENFKVVHQEVDDIRQIGRLCGSKYVQSDSSCSYKIVKQALCNGKLVLFSGTACQIAGLKGFLGMDYPTLLTVDVLCHGVPSPYIWGKYIEHLKKQGTLKKINFRDKKTGWRAYSFTVERDKGESGAIWYNNEYMQLFIDNVSLRDSCFSCRFKDIHHKNSDITLGDFWRVDQLGYENDDTGLSIVQVHSEKGEKVLLEILDQCNQFSNNVDFDEVLPPTDDSRKPVEKNPYSDLFFRVMHSKMPWRICMFSFKFQRKVLKLTKSINRST